MAIYTLRSGATAHPEDSVLQSSTDLVYASGVVDLSTHFKVTAQTVPDMTVKAAIGRAYVKGSASNAYPVRSDASTNATITANGSGNPRIDAVVLYVDLSAVPTTDANNVAKLYVKAGTPAGSPVAPTDGDIATAIGSSNPFLRLANVAVSSGASSITNGNITDTRIVVPHKVLNPGLLITDTDGATVTFDMSVSNKHMVVLGGNRVLALSNVSVGQVFIIRLVQDGSTRTVTWFSTIKWPGGVTPTLTAGGNKADVFGFICTSAGNYDGYIIGQNL